MLNPIQITSTRRSSCIPRIEDFPKTIRANADGTLAIYTSMDEENKTELFTEIPFVAIYGMHTRPRDYNNVGRSSSDETVLKPKVTSFTRPLFIATLAVANIQFMTGYNYVVLNAPEKYVFPGHSTFEWSVAVATLAFGGPIGAAVGGSISEKYGRRFALLLNSLVFLVGGIVQALAPSLEYLTLARFLVGLASGICTVLAPIYLGELAPPHLRGMLGTVNQFAMVIGSFAAYLLSFPYESSWRILFSVTIWFAVLQLCIIPFVVESPRWLLQQNAEDQLGKVILRKLRGNDVLEEDIDRELASYSFATSAFSPMSTKGQSLLMQMLKQPSTRYLFFCCVGLHVMQQSCGVSAVFYYSTSLFDGIIANPLVGTAFVGAVNVLFTYIALFLMDRYQRRTLLLYSIGGMFFSCLLLVLSQAGVVGGNYLAVLSVNVFVAFYEIGTGPIPWLIIAELFEAKYVTLTMTICSQLNWLINFGVGLTFPTIHQALGDLAFLPFCVILFISFVCTYRFIPENHENTLGKVVDSII